MCNLRRFRLVCLLSFLALAFAVQGCARPTSDFNRADKKFYLTHDWLLPLAGTLGQSALHAQLVSRLNYTEPDAQLRLATWNVVLPPHHMDWLGRSKAELMRTRVLKPLGAVSTRTAYHRHLSRQRFASSIARWNRLLNDLNADTALIDPFYDAAHTVLRQDRLRIANTQQLPATGKWEDRNIGGRIEENDEIISWGLENLDRRYAAYHFSFTRLMAEEPLLDDKLLAEVHRALSAYHAAILAARADLDYDRVGEEQHTPLVTKG